MKNNWPRHLLSEIDLDQLEERYSGIYNVSNTIVHPSLIGDLNLVDPRQGLMINNQLLLETLLAYHQTRSDRLTSEDQKFGIVLFDHLEEARETLASALEQWER